MADIKQIKVGDETYNIEPFSQYIKPTVNSEYYPKFIQTKYSKDSSSWYGKDYPMYGFWETNTICKITVDNYSTKVDMAVKDANQNVITDTYATKKAVTQEIKDAIDGLIDGAPGTLNTLKELSAAIGNDKDYAATVTNLITGIDTKVTNETTRAEAAEKTLGKKIGENTNAIAVNANSFKTSITGLSVNGRVITYTKGDGTTGTITTQDTHDNTHLFRLDTRTLNKDPYDTDNYLSRVTWHLKTNSVIGITGQGDYSGLLQLTPWGDKSGGSSHQLAFGTNGAIYHRYGATSWSNWSALAHEGWVSSNYLPRAGGKMTGNIRMSENSTSIIFRDTSADGTKSWLSGIYANSNGDEVLGIVAKNTRTHIMLGNADPEARPACTALTPAIDIKNGKVGINKRIGTDSSEDAGSYNLDVNGSINASGTIDANSARISNGLYVGSSITHKEQENLIIGNSSNGACVNFVEDISVGSDMLTITTSGDIYAEGCLNAGEDINLEGDIYAGGDIYADGAGEFHSGLSVSGGNAAMHSGLSVSGGVTLDGQITAANAIAINNALITLSASSDVHIPVNSRPWSVNTSYSYKHYGPTGKYTLVIPETSSTLIVSSMVNLGSATYSFAGKTATVSPLTGTQQGGGSEFQASVKIPTKTITEITLTHGRSYSFKVTYTKSSSVKSVKTAGVYSEETIYLYPTASTSPTGTIVIGIGGDNGTGSKRAFYGQTNIGAESNTYEVSLGAAGKTYTYLSSPTGTWAYTSDKRDKTDIESINSSLHFINKLQPVTYVENMRENYINEDGTFNQESHQMGVLKKHRRRAGFLAQDVYELLKKEYGTDNYASVVDYNRYKQEDEGIFDRYSFNGVQLIPFLVKAIQEQQDIIESLEEKINLLEEKIQKEVN